MGEGKRRQLIKLSNLINITGLTSFLPGNPCCSSTAGQERSAHRSARAGLAMPVPAHPPQVARPECRSAGAGFTAPGLAVQGSPLLLGRKDGTGRNKKELCVISFGGKTSWALLPNAGWYTSDLKGWDVGKGKEIKLPCSIFFHKSKFLLPGTREN